MALSLLHEENMSTGIYGIRGFPSCLVRLILKLATKASKIPPSVAVCSANLMDGTPVWIFLFWTPSTWTGNNFIYFTLISEQCARKKSQYFYNLLIIKKKKK
jgi:hypothetical protein